MILTLIQMLLNAPFSIYLTFVIEEKYGFNKMTIGTFVMDQVKTLILTALLAAIVLPLVLVIIAKSGPAMVPILAAVSVGLLLLISILVPTLIVPCFFTYSDLQDEELKAAIQQEAVKAQVDISEIKVIDGSQRSSHSNAFVAGMLWFRKVVIFDTLLEQHPHDEILAVVNHELGHVAYSHTTKSVLMSAA
jgi:STE24 endopeptidase